MAQNHLGSKGEGLKDNETKETLYKMDNDEKKWQSEYTLWVNLPPNKEFSPSSNDYYPQLSTDTTWSRVCCGFGSVVLEYWDQLTLSKTYIGSLRFPVFV